MYASDEPVKEYAPDFYLNKKLLEKAHHLNINVSMLLNQALVLEINEICQERQLKTIENECEVINKFIKENGFFSFAERGFLE